MNASVSAVIRGTAALQEVRELLDQLAKVDVCLAIAEDADEAEYQVHGVGNIYVTRSEIEDVINRRCDSILNKLENKGIRVAPDPIALAPPMTEVREA